LGASRRRVRRRRLDLLAALDQRFVRSGDRGEALFEQPALARIDLGLQIGMQLAREPAVRALDRFQIRSA
jgi:hypothetical protein